MPEAVRCEACGWKGHREVPAEYWASVEQEGGELMPGWQPSDITSAIYGDCPECGELLSWDWEVFWAGLDRPKQEAPPAVGGAR